MEVPLIASIPHSGEEIPKEAHWLQGKKKDILLCDVDRFVGELYEPSLKKLKIPYAKTPWHRYVLDLNRFENHLSSNIVEKGASVSEEGFASGLIWEKTTKGDRLLDEPLKREELEDLLKKYYRPFYKEIQELIEDIKSKNFKQMFHLDLHSMPSLGTSAHKDPGKKRPPVVLSDNDGKTTNSFFKKVVKEAFSKEGFSVVFNDPYKSGAITRTFGKPFLGQNSLQVEINRSLYMDEKSKEKLPDFLSFRKRLSLVLEDIFFTLKRSL